MVYNTKIRLSQINTKNNEKNIQRKGAFGACYEITLSNFIVSGWGEASWLAVPSFVSRVSLPAFTKMCAHILERLHPFPILADNGLRKPAAEDYAAPLSLFYFSRILWFTHSFWLRTKLFIKGLYYLIFFAYLRGLHKLAVDLDSTIRLLFFKLFFILWR